MQKLSSGIPNLNSFQKLVKSELFIDMEKFSNEFLSQNQDYLGYYNKWSKDPFHWWSRKWEYPFIFSKISKFIEMNIGSNSNKINLLDAGSGITFFPFYICSKFNNVNLECCDIDKNLGNIFNNVKKRYNYPVNFNKCNIENIHFDDNYFSLIYCISVLEHTENFIKPIEEFHRLLEKDGRLLLTFDISIDGTSEISIDKSIELLKILLDYFKPTEDFNHLNKNINENEVLTTKNHNKNSIFNKFIGLINQMNPLRVKFPYLTVYCISLKKLS